MKKHKPLPVAGYSPQSPEAVKQVNGNKKVEELILRDLDEMTGCEEFDQRWLAIARTHFEQGFMALNRAIFRPTRIALRDGEKVTGQ